MYKTTDEKYSCNFFFIVYLSFYDFKGAVSVLATACNLLQSSSPPEEIQRHRLIEDLDGMESFSVGMRSMPEPPPPYTP